VLTEQSAYLNRWRRISPAAKGLFTLSGIIAAFAAGSPRTALLVALVMSAIAIFGAGVPLTCYLRVVAPPLLFLLASVLSLMISLDFGISTTGLSLHLTESNLLRIAHTGSRSLACLTALLFLALTTPLSDIISLLRRCRVPETLLDLMTLCYRTLFVLSEAVHDTMTAQSARLGYTTLSISMRSLGGLISNLIVQVWQRSLALHNAAEARGNDGALRFLENSYDNTCLSVAIATVSGCLIVALATLLT
jgi:cobalt/nickel transport system permease protein